MPKSNSTLRSIRNDIRKCVVLKIEKKIYNTCWQMYEINLLKLNRAEREREREREREKVFFLKQPTEPSTRTTQKNPNLNVKYDL